MGGTSLRNEGRGLLDESTPFVPQGRATPELGVVFLSVAEVAVPGEGERFGG